jgi:hypothetical protein
VIHGELKQLNPSNLGARKEQGKPVEYEDFKFLSTEIGDDELKTRGIERKHPDLEWYTHLAGDMYRRIHIEATDRVQASRSEHSWVFATRTDPRFDADSRNPNHWRWIDESAKEKAKGKTKEAANEVAAPKPFAGGASTTKISTLVSEPGALLVEGHFAYAEPYPWFNGGANLFGKIGLVADREIGKLRVRLRAQREGKEP